MPQLLPFASHGSEYAASTPDVVEDLSSPKHSRRSALFRNFAGLWKKRHELCEPPQPCLQTAPSDFPPREEYFQLERPGGPHLDAASPLPAQCAPSRPVPSLPRPLTFLRQESERREKLLQVPTCPSGRRTLSLDRRRGLALNPARRSLSPKPVPLPSVSAPEIVKSDQQPLFDSVNAPSKESVRSSKNVPDQAPSQKPTQPGEDIENADEDDEREIDQASLQEEYDRRWILNLSMHFRDKSNREKFFVTYAETPNKWRRLTISLDYRNAPPDSLEADLSTLHFQRDKSLHIYEAIRESLPEIQYYDTVTNLKLETTPEDGQLHVHVREDANEIINYPSTSLFEHVHVRMIPESDVDFISHLSGFVYKVNVDDTTLIKKEIPGPDTIDEFLYEVNALDALLGCKNVVQLEGLVTDDSGEIVKGLLISYASQGALVDMLYDLHGSAQLPWHRREKWAKQIVQGLSDIHEAGFVQGDFTLSNIVIDENDDVQIIDINRRGCPVGWEPPELARLIESGQRIGMCISVKTDLFQLGMVLWALAEEIDEPERIERPLPRLIDTAPTYFSHMVETCLSTRPQGRSSAKRLLRHFPAMAGVPPSPTRPSVDFAEDLRMSDHSVSTHRSDKEYIDPAMAVTLADVNSRHNRHHHERRHHAAANASPISSGQVQYVDPTTRNPDSNPTSSSTYQVESTGSWVLTHRGRSPAVSSRRGRNSPFARTLSSSATSMSGGSPPSRGYRRRRSDCSPVLGLGVGVEREAGFFRDAPRIEITADVEQPAAEDEEGEGRADPMPAPVALLGGGVARYSSLLHTDSGFDETMDLDDDVCARVGLPLFPSPASEYHWPLGDKGAPPRSPRAGPDVDDAHPFGLHTQPSCDPSSYAAYTAPTASTTDGGLGKGLGIAFTDDNDNDNDNRNETHTNTTTALDDSTTPRQKGFMTHDDDNDNNNDDDDDDHADDHADDDLHDIHDESASGSCVVTGLQDVPPQTLTPTRTGDAARREGQHEHEHEHGSEEFLEGRGIVVVG